MIPATNDRCNVSIALLHYPVYDKNRQIVSTAVTNLDLHDIARAAKTFGLFRYYVVTPVAGQQEMAERIACHWQEGWGASYNPRRKAAIDLIRIVNALDDALDDLEATFGQPAKLVVTCARPHKGSVSYKVLGELIRDASQPYLMVFGTGWGLAEEVFERADFVLDPIRGPVEYNHLSVRAAAAIIMDRLFGAR